MENKIPKSIIAHDTFQFPEKKKGNKSANDDDRPTEQLVQVNLMKRLNRFLSMN